MKNRPSYPLAQCDLSSSSIRSSVMSSSVVSQQKHLKLRAQNFKNFKPRFTENVKLINASPLPNLLEEISPKNVEVFKAHQKLSRIEVHYGRQHSHFAPTLSQFDADSSFSVNP